MYKGFWDVFGGVSGEVVGELFGEGFLVRFLKTVFGMFLGSVIAGVTGVRSLEMGFW